MAFTNFTTTAQVQSAYEIHQVSQDFILDPRQEPPPSLVDELAFKRQTLDVFSSESSRKENIIYPILFASYRNHYEKLVIWNEPYLYADDKLSGHPDYLVAARSPLGPQILDKPILMIIEAKQNDFTKGWAQCLAAMVGAQKLNEQPTMTIYGLVTDGELWQFGKLDGTQFTQNLASYTLANLAQIYGSVNWLYVKASHQISQKGTES